MSRPRGRIPHDTADMQGVDPWADAAPLEPARYAEDDEQPVYRRGVYRQPDFRQPDFGRAGPAATQQWPGDTGIGPPVYDPPDGYGYEEYPPPGRRMSPLALAGTIAAVLISIGLVVAMVLPLVTDKKSNTGNPQLPGTVAGPTAPAAVPSEAPPSQIAQQPDPTDPATTAPPAGDQNTGADQNAGAEQAVVNLFNDERQRANCDPLQSDNQVQSAARQHSTDMAQNGFLSQRGSDGSSPADRMQQAGVDNPLTENVARGFASSQAVVRAWLRDRQDRKNIDDCNAQRVGVSVVVADNGTPFWTADFAG